MFQLEWGKLIRKSQRQRVGPIVGIFLLATLTALILRADTSSIVADEGSSSDEAITHPIKPGPLKVPVEEILTYEEMFQEIGSLYDLDWRLLESLAYRESRMDHLATGKSNEMGLMQIAPSTWDEWAPKVEVDDPFDPYGNIQVGAAYLDFVRGLCAERGHTEPHCILVAYNWGPNRLDRFFENGGTWDQIPAIRRKYAIDIVQMAKTRTPDSAFFDELYASVAVGE